MGKASRVKRERRERGEKQPERKPSQIVAVHEETGTTYVAVAPLPHKGYTRKQMKQIKHFVAKQMQLQAIRARRRKKAIADESAAALLVGDAQEGVGLDVRA